MKSRVAIIVGLFVLLSSCSMVHLFSPPLMNVLDGLSWYVNGTFQDVYYAPDYSISPTTNGVLVYAALGMGSSKYLGIGISSRQKSDWDWVQYSNVVSGMACSNIDLYYSPNVGLYLLIMPPNGYMKTYIRYYNSWLFYGTNTTYNGFTFVRQVFNPFESNISILYKDFTISSDFNLIYNSSSGSSMFYTFTNMVNTGSDILDMTGDFYSEPTSGMYIIAVAHSDNVMLYGLDQFHTNDTYIQIDNVKEFAKVAVTKDKRILLVTRAYDMSLYLYVIEYKDNQFHILKNMKISDPSIFIESGFHNYGVSMAYSKDHDILYTAFIDNKYKAPQVVAYYRDIVTPLYGLPIEETNCKNVKVTCDLYGKPIVSVIEFSTNLKIYMKD